MPNYLEWRDEYNLGYASIDKQHQQIIGIINAVFIIVREGGPGEDLLKALSDLHIYTIKHFTFEEELLGAVGYPDRESHELLHLKMRERTDVLVGRHYHAPSEDLAEETLALLKGWWLNHIRGVDTLYAPYLEKLEETEGA